MNTGVERDELVWAAEGNSNAERECAGRDDAVRVCVWLGRDRSGRDGPEAEERAIRKDVERSDTCGIYERSYAHNQTELRPRETR